MLSLLHSGPVTRLVSSMRKSNEDSTRCPWTLASFSLTVSSGRSVAMCPALTLGTNFYKVTPSSAVGLGVSSRAYTNLICVPAPHVVRRDSLEDLLENLCVAFRGGRPQDVKLVGEGVCDLEILFGLGNIIMRIRYGSHETGDFVTVGETELRLDETKMLWCAHISSPPSRQTWGTPYP
jgi:hypothetical protein